MVIWYIVTFMVGVLGGFVLMSLFAGSNRDCHVIHIFKNQDGTINKIEHDVEDIVIVHESKE